MYNRKGDLMTNYDAVKSLPYHVAAFSLFFYLVGATNVEGFWYGACWVALVVFMFNILGIMSIIEFQSKLLDEIYKRIDEAESNKK